MSVKRVFSGEKVYGREEKNSERISSYIAHHELSPVGFLNSSKALHIRNYLSANQVVTSVLGNSTQSAF